MEEETIGIDEERKQQHEEDASVTEILRDRFRLSTISIAEAEGFVLSKIINLNMKTYQSNAAFSIFFSFSG